jgi:nitrile hydratase beta subunit-like protein
MEPAFKPSDRVRVRVDDPPRHIRTPAYVQGKVGRIAAVHGAFGNPETLAYGGDGQPAPFLYLVRFDQADLWDDPEAPHDQLFIDIYEHWLEPACSDRVPPQAPLLRRSDRGPHSMPFLHRVGCSTRGGSST